MADLPKCAASFGYLGEPTAGKVLFLLGLTQSFSTVWLFPVTTYEVMLEVRF